MARTRRRPLARLRLLGTWVLLVGLTLTTVGCAQGPGAEPAPADPARYTGSWLSEGYPVPDVTLYDTSGGHFDVQTSPSRPVTVMFFGYTHCPEQCTGSLGTLHAALESLPDHLAGKIQVVVVSVDPDRDSPGSACAAVWTRCATWPGRSASRSAAGRPCPTAATTSPTAPSWWAWTTTTPPGWSGSRAPAPRPWPQT